MSHFAQVKDGIVQQVIVAEQDFIDLLPDTQDWIQTSYRTHRNQHPEGRPLRGNYAGQGYTYDAENDVFYPPSPYASWQLNPATWDWQAPLAAPEDSNQYAWDESTQSWVITQLRITNGS